MHHVIRTVFYLRSGAFDGNKVSNTTGESLATRSFGPTVGCQAKLASPRTGGKGLFRLGPEH